MTQPMPLSARARLAAANCLGLSPHPTPAEVHAAVAAALPDHPIEDVFRLPIDGPNPVTNRKVAAAQLLLTSATSRTHLRRACQFVNTDAKVPEQARMFQAPAPDSGAEQGELFRAPAPAVLAAI